MATTVYYCASSLDGYIAEADDSLDWLLGHQGNFESEVAEPSPMSEGGAYEGFYEGVRALVMGSATYEWILDHLDVAGGDRWGGGGLPRPMTRGQKNGDGNRGLNGGCATP